MRGDVDEEFVRFVSRDKSPRAARWWYRKQVAGSVYRVWKQEFDEWATGGRWMMGGVLKDVRLAVRNLVRSPGFASMVLVTLGLGIGATTAIFSAANEVVFRPLGFEDADRLVMLWERNQERGWDQVHAAPANVLDWRERVEAFFRRRHGRRVGQ